MNTKNSLVNISDTERKLAERVNQSVTGQLAVSDKAGGISFVSVSEIMEFAKLMAISNVAVPKHLRGNPGACMAICVQALEWQMSPFAVANKSYSVSDRLAYEAQLIEAVILRRAPIKGRPKLEYRGEGDARICRVWAELRDEPGEIVSYESPPFGRITPKNSPLWKADPDQQHFYFSVRAWCRRHFPDVLLGVYARDEIEESQRSTAAIGLRRPTMSLDQKLDELADLSSDTDAAVDAIKSAMDEMPPTDDDAEDTALSTEDSVEQEIEQSLHAAAQRGIDALQEEWSTLHVKHQRQFQALKERILKPMAREADEARART